MKDKLANTMTYGDIEQKPRSPPRITKQKSKVPTKKEQWNDCKPYVQYTQRVVAACVEAAIADLIDF